MTALSLIFLFVLPTVVTTHSSQQRWYVCCLKAKQDFCIEPNQVVVLLKHNIKKVFKTASIFLGDRVDSPHLNTPSWDVGCGKEFRIPHDALHELRLAVFDLRRWNGASTISKHRHEVTSQRSRYPGEMKFEVLGNTVI